MHDAGDDPISLSFIDCISCGLAAALFLFLVFAAIPRAAALLATQIEEGSASGAISEGTDAQLPPLFVGDGDVVPVDIRVEFKSGPMPISAIDWGSTTFDRSTYQPSRGLASVSMISLRSNDTPPKLSLIGEVQQISGQITIKAGGASRQMQFDCPPVQSGARLQVLAFDGGAPVEGCAP